MGLIDKASKVAVLIPGSFPFDLSPVPSRSAGSLWIRPFILYSGSVVNHSFQCTHHIMRNWINIMIFVRNGYRGLVIPSRCCRSSWSAGTRPRTPYYSGLAFLCYHTFGFYQNPQHSLVAFSSPLFRLIPRRGAVNGWIMISFCQEMACLAVYSGF